MTARPSAIALRDIRYRWPGAETSCLEIERFDLNAGERIFLHGPSGSGKSTLLSLVGGVIEPQRGSVAVHGQPLAALQPGARDRFRADRIGFIFQLFNLIPHLTALENILLPCRFSPARLSRLRKGGATPTEEARRLADRLHLDPNLLIRSAGTLSVGQQQRVAAARALIGRPTLVIADEPTSALDADRQIAFLDLLLSECRAAQAALLFVSHDARLADHFDGAVSLMAINRVEEATT